MARIVGKGGADILRGLEENDLILGRKGDDSLYGDSVVNGVETISDDTLKGAGGADHLFGGPGTNVLLGQNGADQLAVGVGTSLAKGGRGDDFFSFAPHRSAETAARDTIVGGAGTDTLSLVVWSVSFSSFEMRGDLDGGALLFANGARLAKASGIEALEISTSQIQQATLVGGDGNDDIRMFAGQMDASTGKGDDYVWVNASSGASTINMGAGDDTVLVNAGGLNSPAVRYDFKSDAAVRIGGVDVVSITGAEHLDIIGSVSDDRIFGAAGNDTLSGGLGQDTLNGRGGDDLLSLVIDGSKNIVKGGHGTDVLQFSAATLTSPLDMSDSSGTTVSVRSETGQVLVNGKQIEAVKVTGSSGSDKLVGLSGDDSLWGAFGGNDTLHGHEGDDTLKASSGNTQNVLIGGKGADTFMLRRLVDDASVKVRDFSAVDKLSVAELLIQDLSDVELVAKRAPTAQNDVLTFLFNTKTGLLQYDADGTGPGQAIPLMTLLLKGEAADLTLDQFV